MKKLSYLLSLTAVAGMVLLYSCGKDEDPEPVVTTPDACAEATEFLSGATGEVYCYAGVFQTSLHLNRR